MGLPSFTQANSLANWVLQRRVLLQAREGLRSHAAPSCPGGGGGGVADSVIAANLDGLANGETATVDRVTLGARALLVIQTHAHICAMHT